MSSAHVFLLGVFAPVTFDLDDQLQPIDFTVAVIHQHDEVAWPVQVLLMKNCEEKLDTHSDNLRHVFTALPKAKTLEDIKVLLPWNIDPVSLIAR